MALQRRGKVQTELEVTGEKKYKEDVKSATKSLDNLKEGAKGVDKALRDVGGAAGVMAAGITAGLAVAQTVWGEFIALGERAVEVYGQLGQRGGAVAAVAGYFEQIASPGTLERLQRLSGWHVSQQTIMEDFNQTMEVNLVSQREFAEWFQRTVSVAQSAGRPIIQTWEQVATALRGGGAEALQGLGVNVTLVNEQLRAMGVSGDSLEGKSKRLGLALSQLREITGEANNAASNLSDTWEATTVQAGDFYDQVARIVSTSPAAVGAFETFREKLFGIEGQAGKAGEAIARIAQITIRSAALGVDWTARWIEMMGGLWGRFYSLLPMGEDIQRRFENITAMATQARAVAQATFQAAGAATVAAEGAGATRPIGEPARAPRAPGRREEPQFEILSYDEMIEESLARINETQQGINESSQLWLDIIGSQTELQQAQFEQMQMAYDAEQERLREKAETQAAMREAEAAALEEANRAALEHHERLMSNFDLAAGAASTLGSIFGQIADNQEAAGKAADGWRKAMGVALGIEYTIRAIAAGAEAIGAFASLNILGGLAYTAQAVEYGVAAGLAFSKLAQTGGAGVGAGAGAPAASAGSFIPARTEGLAGPTRPETGGNTYNIFSLGSNDADVAAAMARAEYRRGRTGTIARVPSSGVRYET